MIEILKSYFTKDGRKIVVLEYKGGKYLCSDTFGNRFYLEKSDLLLSKNKTKIIEPTYYDNKVSFSEEELKVDNLAETNPAIEESFLKVEKTFEEGLPFEEFVKAPEVSEETFVIEEKPKKTEVEEDDFYEDLL